MNPYSCGSVNSVIYIIMQKSQDVLAINNHNLTVTTELSNGNSNIK